MTDISALPAVESSEGAERRADRDRQKSEEDRDRQKEKEKRAKARDASEKQPLSWVRIAMSLASTGIRAQQALAYAERLEARFRVDAFNFLKVLPISLVIFGLATLGMACFQHVHLLLSLKATGRCRREGLAQPNCRRRADGHLPDRAGHRARGA